MLGQCGAVLAENIDLQTASEYMEKMETCVYCKGTLSHELVSKCWLLITVLSWLLFFFNRCKCLQVQMTDEDGDLIEPAETEAEYNRDLCMDIATGRQMNSIMFV